MYSKLILLLSNSDGTEKQLVMKLHIHPTVASIICKEPLFEVFKANGLYCCVKRILNGGTFCGYAAVGTDHPLFSMGCDSLIHVVDADKVPFNGNYIGLLATAFDPSAQGNLIRLDMALEVHGGLTYADDCLAGIDNELFGLLWWFGFDTSHCYDLQPFEFDFGAGSLISLDRTGASYRTFEYVKEQTMKLARQLAAFPVTEK